MTLSLLLWASHAANALFPVPGAPLIQNRRDSGEFVLQSATADLSHSRPTNPSTSAPISASCDVGRNRRSSLSISPASRWDFGSLRTVRISARLVRYHS